MELLKWDLFWLWQSYDIGLLVTLTEYGFCIADRTVRNEFHRDQEGHVHGTNLTSNKVLVLGTKYEKLRKIYNKLPLTICLEFLTRTEI